MYLDDVVFDAARAVKALTHVKHQTLSLSSLPEAGCKGDADLLTQAMVILLDNAVKFTPSGGSIDLALFRRGDMWVCSVADNGVGVAETAQTRIFERFFRECRPSQTATAGAGLGLAIARTIMEEHEGTLALVESHPGRTLFEMTIPVFEMSTEEHYANSWAVSM